MSNFLRWEALTLDGFEEDHRNYRGFVPQRFSRICCVMINDVYCGETAEWMLWESMGISGMSKGTPHCRAHFEAAA